MAITVQPQYATGVALTITLASLATSSTRTAGEQSNEIDNTTTKYDDIEIAGKITTGTSPAASKQIDIWVIPIKPYAAAYPDVITNAGDAAKTWTSENVRNAGGVLLKSILVDSTSNQTYHFSGLSVKSAVGFCPRKFVMFVAHDTGANLHATGSNHAIEYAGLNYGV
jgi:hypothetical protein